MQENIYVQIYVFLFTLYGGLIIGIIYDSIDILLYGLIVKKRNISDVLFWLAAFTIMLIILFYSNNIIFRAYVFIGFWVGWLLYFFTISYILRKFLKFISKLIVKLCTILSVLFKFILKLLKILFKPFNTFLTKEKNKMLNITQKVVNIVKIEKESYNKYKKYF